MLAARWGAVLAGLSAVATLVVALLSLVVVGALCVLVLLFTSSAAVACLFFGECR